MLVLSGISFVGSILYWNYGEPELPNPSSYTTLGQYNSAAQSYTTRYDMYKRTRVGLGIATGFLFVSGSVLLAAGKLRRDIYLSRKYALNIGIQQEGFSVNLKF